MIEFCVSSFFCLILNYGRKFLLRMTIWPILI